MPHLVSRFEEDWEAVHYVARGYDVKPFKMAQYGYEHQQNGWPVPWLKDFVKRLRVPLALRMTASESMRLERQVYQGLVAGRGHKHVK
jgi:hypothetical protein